MNAKQDDTARQANGATVRSISAMVLAPDGRLVVADWRSGLLHVLELPDTPSNDAPRRYNIRDLDIQLGTLVGVRPESVRVSALVHQADLHRVVLAVTAPQSAAKTVHLVVGDADGSFRSFDPSALRISSIGIEDLPPDVRIWDRFETRSFTVTDMMFYEGSLLLTGLANSSFVSTFRRVHYPFRGTTVAAGTSLEMFHPIHDQLETRAPIRAFTVIDVEGEPTLLGAYTCTPLVTVPLAELRAEARVRAKTVAELGFAGTPLAVIPFDLERDGQTSSWVLVANSSKTADLLRLEDVRENARGPGLSKMVHAPFEVQAGIRSLAMPITGVQRLVDQDARCFLALRRAVDSSRLELVSIGKGDFFRLTDFVTEYDFPNYAPRDGDKGQAEYFLPYHRMMMEAEGFESPS
ncbi:MAG: hypothetical protein AAGF12_24785 [Myxococcota bacterium]